MVHLYVDDDDMHYWLIGLEKGLYVYFLCIIGLYVWKRAYMCIFLFPSRSRSTALSFIKRYPASMVPYGSKYGPMECLNCICAGTRTKR